MKLSSYIKFILSLSCIFFLGSTAFAAKKTSPIVIGILAPLTGDFANYGLPVKNSATIAVEKINKAGGVNGHKLVLAAEDSQCKPELAINIAHKFADMHLSIVIGGVCSGSTQAALPVFNKAHIVVISPSATATNLTDGSNPNFFRLIPPDNFQGEFQADFLINNLKAKTIAILHDKDAYGKGIATILRDQAKGKIKVVAFEGITVGAVDYSAVASKLRRLKPDAVAFEGYMPEGTKLLTQFYKKRLKMPVIVPESHKSDVLFNLKAKYRANTYVSSPLDPSSLKTVQPISKILTQRKQRTTAFGIYAYSITQIIAQVLEQTKTINYKNIHTALDKGKFKTIIGEVQFSPKGDILKKNYVMYKAGGTTFVPAK